MQRLRQPCAFIVLLLASCCTQAEDRELFRDPGAASGQVFLASTVASQTSGQVDDYPPVEGEAFGATSDSDYAAGLESRLQRMEAELEQLRNRPVFDSAATLEQRLLQQDVGTGGLFGSVEVTFLRPHLSGATALYAYGPPVERFVDPGYTTSVRYVLGYVSDSGLGIQGRFWQFNDNYGYIPPNAPNDFGIRLDVADLEVTLAQRLRHWDLGVTGGVRYGQLQYSNPSPTLFAGAGMVTFEGVGPTVSLNGRRMIGNSGVSLFGNVRGSMLAGSVRNGGVLVNLLPATIHGEIMTVAENQLGVAWTRDLSQTFQLELRTAWETQYWMSDTLSDDVYGVGTNLALTGPTLAVELKY